MCNYNIKQKLIEKVFEMQNLCYLLRDSEINYMVDWITMYGKDNIEKCIEDCVKQLKREKLGNYYNAKKTYIFSINEFMDFCIKYGKCEDKYDFCDFFLEHEYDAETSEEYDMWKKVIIDNQYAYFIVEPYFDKKGKLKRVVFSIGRRYDSPNRYPEFVKQYLSENSVKTKG